jgi:hypothetical protein
MNRGTKTLANFSVSQSSQTKDEEVPKKLTQIQKDIAEWAIVVKSGGNIGRGGRAQSRMAAKNIYGDRDFPAGRTWVTTGMGANEKSFSGLRLERQARQIRVAFGHAIPSWGYSLAGQ